jgi:hypothetical protein
MSQVLYELPPNYEQITAGYTGGPKKQSDHIRIRPEHLQPCRY